MPSLAPEKSTGPFSWPRLSPGDVFDFSNPNDAVWHVLGEKASVW
jgi:hypothetical protein